MSQLSPSKQRTLSRQPSSPSLAVGLPPALPETHLMSPSSPSKPRVRRQRVHRGDVESSGGSSGGEDEWVLPTTPSADAHLSVSNTPKRKVVNMVEGVPATSRKRDTLQARLQQAARMKKSRSAGDGLSMSLSHSSISALASASSSFLPLAESFKERVLSGGEKERGSDKVIVCVRIKPTRSAFPTMAYDVSPRSLSLSDEHPSVQKRGGKAGREEEYTYTFDALLQYPSRTPELYSDKVANLVDKAMNGFNSTIFAYGSTGSGKSYTMTGMPTELGIIPCAIDGVFDAISADPERAFLLRVSYLEIYNESLRDLLNHDGSKEDEKPVIRSSSKGKVWVDRLVEEVVSTPQEVLNFLGKGNENRKVGATDWNERSSRSHSVFTIVIESRPRDGNGDTDVRVSSLNLIDLAGSEKAVSDLERRGEGKHINQSLLALREVINKLTEKKKAAHVPYRNSKLTHLLENALGGDSNICVICTISVEEEHTAETLETLKFAGRCSQVETKAKKNILMSSDKALIRAKDQEIEELKRKLQRLAQQRISDAGSSSQATELEESVADLEARKAKLTSQLARLNGEILTSELPRVGSMSALPLNRPKRRRISDFANLMGGGRLGMGSPKMRVSDRRAVSGIVRLGEDDMPSLVGIVEGEVSNSFETECTIAILRRDLASKDAELAALKLKIADPASDTALRDSHVQLEATRVELVRTVDEKSARIDELENTILDLRSSREELVVEDEHRLADMRKELDYAREQLEAERKAKELADEELAKARGEMDDFQQKVMQNSSHQDLRAEIAKLREEAEKAKSENTKIAERYSAAVMEKEEMRVSMESERRRAKTAERGLSQFQNASMSNDAATQKFRTEVEEMRRKCEDAERARDELQHTLDIERSQGSGSQATQAELQASQQVAATLQAELDSAKSEAQAVHQRLSDELAEVKQRYDAVLAGRNEIEQELEAQRALALGVSAAETRASAAEGTVVALQQQLSELQTRHNELPSSDEIANLRSSLDSVHGSLAETSRKFAVSEEHAKTLESDITFLRADKASLVDQLEALRKESTASTDLSRQLAEAQESSRLHTERTAELEKSKESLQKELEDLQTTISTLPTKVEMDLLKTALDAAQDALGSANDEAAAVTKEKTRLAGMVEKLEVQVASLKSLATDGDASLKQALETAQCDLAAARTAHDTCAQDQQTVTQRVHNLEAEMKSLVESAASEKATLLAQVKVLEEQSVVHATLVQERDSLVQEKDALFAKVKLLEEQGGATHATLLAERDTALERIKTLDGEIAAAHATLLLEQESALVRVKSLEDHAGEALGASKQAYEVATAELQSLQHQLDSLSATTVPLSDYESIKAALKDTRDALDDQRIQVRDLLQKQEALVADHQKALSAASGPTVDVEALKASLASAKKEVADARDAQINLTAQLADAEDALAKLKAAQTALPTGADITQLKSQLSAAQNAASRAQLQAAKESAEVEKLELVIEEQKMVIDAQREKILYWQRQLELQGEVVRKLTEPAPLPASPTASPGSRHTKSKSLALPSSSLDPAAQTGAPKKAGLPSTFTAHNLALPSSSLTLAKPKPLPSHPSQWSNTSSKRGRRVTIEHDIDLLSDSSRVLQAKKIFDSPKGDMPPPASLKQRKA